MICVTGVGGDMRCASPPVASHLCSLFLFLCQKTPQKTAACSTSVAVAQLLSGLLYYDFLPSVVLAAACSSHSLVFVKPKTKQMGLGTLKLTENTVDWQDGRFQS